MYQTTGEQIKKIRDKKGMSQERFGEKIGVSGKTISAYETGKVIPPIKILEKITAVYGTYIQIPDLKDKETILETLLLIRNKIMEVENRLKT